MACSPCCSGIPHPGTAARSAAPQARRCTQCCSLAASLPPATLCRCASGPPRGFARLLRGLFLPPATSAAVLAFCMSAMHFSRSAPVRFPDAELASSISAMPFSAAATESATVRSRYSIGTGISLVILARMGRASNSSVSCQYALSAALWAYDADPIFARKIFHSSASVCLRSDGFLIPGTAAAWRRAYASQAFCVSCCSFVLSNLLSA